MFQKTDVAIIRQHINLRREVYKPRINIDSSYASKYVNFDKNGYLQSSYPTRWSPQWSLFDHFLRVESVRSGRRGKWPECRRHARL